MCLPTHDNRIETIISNIRFLSRPNVASIHGIHILSSLSLQIPNNLKLPSLYLQGPLLPNVDAL